MQPNLAYESEDSTSRSRQLIQEEARRQTYTRTRAELISRHVENPGNLLEIGAGTGAFLAEMEHRGWIIEGIEPAPLLHERGARRLGREVPFHSCDLSGAEEVLLHQPYQAIMALDVLEHLPDPFLLPRKAFDWLAPGGYLFLQTPNVESLRHRLHGADWEQLAPGEHYILHSANSLHRVIEEAGLTVEEIHTVSGGATDTPLRRVFVQTAGVCLNLLGLGNALWAVARKRPS